MLAVLTVDGCVESPCQSLLKATLPSLRGVCIYRIHVFSSAVAVYVSLFCVALFIPHVACTLECIKSCSSCSHWLQFNSFNSFSQQCLYVWLLVSLSQCTRVRMLFWLER